MKKILILMLLTLTSVFASINAQGFYLSFDGVNDYATVPTLLTNDSQDWVFETKFTFRIDDGEDFFITSGGPTNNDRAWQLFTFNNNNILRFNVYDTNGNTHVISLIQLVNDTTYIFRAEHDVSAKTIDLYVDNTYIDTLNYSGTIRNNSNLSVFGSFTTQNDYFANIDLYYFTANNHEYLLNEGSGTSINDSIGNEDGTIQGATWAGGPAVTYPVDINLTSNYGDYFDANIQYQDNDESYNTYPINAQFDTAQDYFQATAPTSGIGDYVFQHWYDLDNDEIFSTNSFIQFEPQLDGERPVVNLEARYTGVSTYNIDLNMESGISGNIQYQGNSFNNNTVNQLGPIIDQTVPAGTEWTANAPNVAGYNFDGWYLPNGTLSTTSQTVGSTDTQVNFDLEARYSQIPTYLIDATSDLPSPPDFQFQVDQEPVILEYPINRTVTEGDNVYITAPTQNIGFYEFDGWYELPSNTLIETNDTILFSNIMEDKTIIARYTLPDEYQINLTLTSQIGDIQFQVDGGTPIFAPSIDETLFAGQSFQATAPSDPDYQFLHWYDLENNQVFNINEAISAQDVDRDYILEARYSQIFTLTFNSAGGTVVNDITALDGESIDLPEPTREGFIFGGWYETSDPFQVVVSEPYTVVSDIDFTARWNPIIEVSFNSNGGTDVPSQFVTGSGLVTEPAIPSRFGYIFDGWYLDNNTFANPYDFTSPIPFNVDFALHAKWILGSDSDIDATLNDWVSNSGLPSLVIVITILLAVSVTLGLIGSQMFVIVITNISLLFVFTSLGFIPLWILLVAGLAITGFMIMMLFGGRNNA